MISQKNKQGWRNPWVLVLIVIILVALANNGRMLIDASEHKPRMLDDSYSVKSKKEEAKWVQQQAERSTLGWQATLRSNQQLENDRMATPQAARFILIANPAELQFDLKDKDGKAVSGAQVKVLAQWPVGQASDFSATLQEAHPGHYVGNLAFPRAGNWDLVIKAQHDGSLFELEQKVFVAVPN